MTVGSPGRPPGELTLRLATVNFDGGEALAHVPGDPPDERLSDAFLRRWCGEVMEVIDRIFEWANAE